MCSLAFKSCGLGEKPTLQVGIIPKKVAGATTGVGTLQGFGRRRPLRPPAPATAVPPASRSSGVATGRPTENLNPRSRVRLRTHRTFRKLVRLVTERGPLGA